METDAVKKKGAIKGTLRVKGQANQKGPAAKCDLPAFCERCKKKTLGSLQLPCGRQVRLCEACSLEFYDILMAKISQNDAEFQAFLREQKRKEKEAAKEKEQSIQTPSSRGALTTPKRVPGGRLAGTFDNGENLDGWKTTQDGRPAAERQRAKDIFIPVNRPHSSRDAMDMPLLHGKPATGPPQRPQRSSHGKPHLSVQTGDSPGNRRGSQVDVGGSHAFSPGSPGQPRGLVQASIALGQDINLVGSSQNTKYRGTSFVRNSSGGSLGSNGSQGSRGSSNSGGLNSSAASAARRHSSATSGGGGAILRSSEIRQGGKAAMGGVKQGTGVGVNGRPGPWLGQGPAGQLEELLKTSPHMSRNTSIREIRQKIGAMEDLMSLQGLRRA